MIKHRLVIQNYQVDDATIPGEKTLSTVVKWISDWQYGKVMEIVNETQTENKE